MRATSGPEGPLQLPQYETEGAGYRGLAESQKADDFDQQTKDSGETQKQMVDLLKQILTTNQDGNSLQQQALSSATQPSNFSLN